jgi:outer membrane protein
MNVFRPLAAAAALTFAAIAAPAPAWAADPVVVVDFQRLYKESTAGKDAEAKLKAIADGIQKELQPEGAALQTEQQALGPKFQGKTQEQIVAALKADQSLQTKYNAFIQRSDAFLQKRSLRQQEFAATEQKAVSDVLNAAAPDVTAAMNAKGAAVVIERRDVVTSTPNVDITADVVNRFNQRVKSVPVALIDLTKRQQ